MPLTLLCFTEKINSTGTIILYNADQICSFINWDIFKKKRET